MWRQMAPGVWAHSNATQRRCERERDSDNDVTQCSAAAVAAALQQSSLSAACLHACLPPQYAPCSTPPIRRTSAHGCELNTQDFNRAAIIPPSLTFPFSHSTPPILSHLYLFPFLPFLSLSLPSESS